MNNKFIEIVKKNKVMFVIGGIIIFVLIVVLIILLFNQSGSEGDVDNNSASNNNSSQNTDRDGGSSEQEDERDDSGNDDIEGNGDGSSTTNSSLNGYGDDSSNFSGEAGFHLANGSYVTDFINYSSGGSMAIDLINTAITEYMVVGGNENYSGSIVGNSVSKTIYFPYDMVSFEIESSASAYYGVKIALEETRYYGMTVTDDNDTNNPTKFYVVLMRSPEDAGYNTDEVVARLTRWAQKVNPDLAILQPTIYTIY